MAFIITCAWAGATPAPAQAQATPAVAAPAAAASAAAADPAPATPMLERVEIIGTRPVPMGPLPGPGISRDQVPANVQSATREDLKRSRALNLADYMNSNLQGVSVNDYAGNPFQVDVNFRGFTASPQIGTPQGLSVFFDGVRVNEPFGDVVNWDLLPLNAIERVDLYPGSNPLFGLNTLGGAIALRSKSGFTAPGVEAQALAGSWGRQQLQLSGGRNDGQWGGFFAVTRFDEDGWRDESPSRVSQGFGRADWRGALGTATASVLLADNRLVGNGLIPLALYQQRPEAVFTAPDEARNRLAQWTLGGQWDLSPGLNATGQVYRRDSQRRGLNGDVYGGFDEFEDDDDSVLDPANPFNSIPRNGANSGTSGVVAGTPIGLLTSTALKQVTTGAAAQLNWTLERHAAMLGGSADRSRASYAMTQRLGLIDAQHRVATDAGIPYFAAQNDIPGNDFSGTSLTRSVYASDTWTPQAGLHVTGSARFNHTRVRNELQVRAAEGNVDLHELAGANAGRDAFVRTTSREAFTYRSFNPSLGAAWTASNAVNLFGNLSRGARAPSVVELGCAFDATPTPWDPANPQFGSTARSLTGPGCNLPTTLAGDPYLPQIRAKSGELGARGHLDPGWEWNISTFRTDLKDDLYFVGVGDGRSYFDTIGKTRRQGLELGLSGRHGALEMKLDYAYTEATFESTFYTVSPHNSSADFDQNSRGVGDLLTFGQLLLPSPGAFQNRGFGTFHMIRVDPGDRMPGVPLHALNLNLRWQATPQWRWSLGLLARSRSYMRGNENNQHQPGGSDLETGQYYCTPASAGSQDCDANGYRQTATRPGRPFTQNGTVPGYSVFNLDANYAASPALSVFVRVTNLFNRKYFTAGRLGVNPFSPATVGAVGASGWNYNSSEWQTASFAGPGGPRGLFVGLAYDLDGK